MTAFRLTLLPLAALLAAGCLPDEEAAPPPADARPLVRVCSLTEGLVFEDAVRIQGSVRTKHVAALASRLPGTIDELLADEGDAVAQGQPLFQVDRVNLENAVAIAKDDRQVAEAARAEAEAACSEAEAAVEKATVDEARCARLYADSRSVSKDTWEKAQLQLKSVTAKQSRARAALASAEAHIQKAATALRIAEKNLADSRGLAPFAGVITKRLRERGDFVGAGTVLFMLDDPRVREVCFTLTADRYADVEVGKTLVRTALGGGLTLPVTYKAPSVHPVSRTFEIRAALPEGTPVAPGMLCDATLVFDARTGVGLPASAVALRNGETVAFTVVEGVVRSVPAQKGRSAGGMVEILNPEALGGAPVVSEGMLLLNPGDAVRAVR